MIVHELEKIVSQAIQSLKTQGVLNFAKEPPLVVFEHPESSEHGDYSTNVALVLGQQLNQAPREIADLIHSKLKTSKHEFLSKIKVEGPGFINFFLHQEYLFKELQEIAKKKEKYGQSTAQKKKVMVEFTDPNPFKEFHIGHLYSNTVGESLSRLLEAQGAQVKRANYQGDVGLHVAKAVWGMQKSLEGQHLSLKELEKKDLSERVKFLGHSYAKGDQAYETRSAKEEIETLNTKIFANDKVIQALYEKGRKWSLKYFEYIYKRLGTKFDYYYFESEVGNIGKKLVEKGMTKGIFEKSQGAVIFPGEKYGLHSRVFINSKGLPTYEAKELGLAPTKYKDFKYDLSLVITGNEIVDYFKVLLAALKEMNPELAEKTKHLSHGMVRFPEGKMSSRTGNVVTGEEVIEEVKSRVRSIMKSSGSEIPQKEQAAESIAVGAIKYSLLRVSLGRDIAFDFEKSLNLQGESGPYLQYTYARCKSILRQSSFAKLSFGKLSLAKLSIEEERILRLLYRFPEMARDAAESFSPNIVCSFVFDVAQAYNNFYNIHRVLQAETKEKKNFRILLTTATAHIIQNSLKLLGIKTLEHM